MPSGMRSRRALAFASVLLACVLVAAGQGDATARPDPRSKVHARAGELRLERKVRIGASDLYRYRQVVGGYEVLGSRAVVVARGDDQDAFGDTTRRDIRAPKREAT